MISRKTIGAKRIWAKILQTRRPRILIAAFAALLFGICLHAADSSTKARFDQLSHRMMCTCGCNELLGECSHAGCQSSAAMSRELTAMLAAGRSDEEILSAFSGKYGPTVLAAPSAKGFNLVAWITPFALLILGLIGIILIVRRAQRKQAAALAQAGPAAALAQVESSVLERIRRETGGEDGK